MMKKIMVPFFLGLIAVSRMSFAEEPAVKTYYPNGKVQMELNGNGQKTFYEDGTRMSRW